MTAWGYFITLAEHYNPPGRPRGGRCGRDDSISRAEGFPPGLGHQPVSLPDRMNVGQKVGPADENRVLVDNRDSRFGRDFPDRRVDFRLEPAGPTRR